MLWLNYHKVTSFFFDSLQKENIQFTFSRKYYLASFFCAQLQQMTKKILSEIPDGYFKNDCYIVVNFPSQWNFWNSEDFKGTIHLE